MRNEKLYAFILSSVCLGNTGNYNLITNTDVGLVHGGMSNTSKRVCIRPV